MDSQGELDLESFKCFLPLLFVGLFMSFLNISYIGMGAFNLDFDIKEIGDKFGVFFDKRCSKDVKIGI